MSAFGRRGFVGRVAVAASLPHIFWPSRGGRAVDAPEDRTTPPLAVFKRGSLPEQSFYRQVIGKRIGRWYARAPQGFPRAVSLAQAAMDDHDRNNIQTVLLRRTQGYFADQPSEEETIRRRYFARWDKKILGEEPNFWSFAPETNQRLLGATLFPQEFKGFILLSQGQTIPEASVTYDHELTHYYILIDKDRKLVATALTCLLSDDVTLEAIVKKVFGVVTEANLEKSRYWLKPAEIDVSLAEIKRRFVYNQRQHLQSHVRGLKFVFSADVWKWWAEQGAKQSRDSEEPAGIASEQERFRLLDSLPNELRGWLFKRLLELV